MLMALLMFPSACVAPRFPVVRARAVPWEGFNDLLGRPQRFLADGTLYISCVTMPAGYGALRAMGLININPFEWAMR
jgi:hypothetical protein